MNANALGLLRFVLAMLVVWVHYEQLTTSLIGWDVTEWGLSHLAVNCFFVLSGFLMPHSFEHAKGVASFYKKRFLRIYLAYFVVVTVAAVALFAISKCNLGQYFNSEWLRYYSLNLLTLNFLKPDLSCLFQDHAITVVNGSLWSIKVEMMFYVVVPFIYSLHQNAGEKKWWLWAIFIFLALVANIGFSVMALHADSPVWDSMLNQLPAKLCFFLAGWCLFYVHKRQDKALVYLLALGFVFGILGHIYISHDYEVVQIPLCMGLVYLFFSVKINSRQTQEVFKFLGGVSYALYLMHFPLIQLFIALQKQQVIKEVFLPWIVVFFLLSIIVYILESKILDYCKRKFKMD